MKKDHRLKKNKDFQTVFRKGKSKANRQFVVYYLQGDESFRFGLSVSKKIGNAVVRNRIKRYIREAVGDLEDRIVDEGDIIIIARKPTADMNIHQIKKSLNHVFRRSGLFKKMNQGELK